MDDKDHTWIAGLLAGAIVVLGYVLARWVGLDNYFVMALLLAPFLVGLAYAGYRGGQQGRTGPYVAVALVLPYLLGAVVAWGTQQRLAGALGQMFEGSEESDSVSSDDLESEVERLATESGLSVDSVDCPDALPAEVDAQVGCAFTTSDGEERAVEVTATKVRANGEVSFDVTESTPDDNGESVPDANGDGIPDDSEAGTDCSTKYKDDPLGQSLCEDNGGTP